MNNEQLGYRITSVRSIKRFRILVIGNANAGKTTILDNFCHAQGRKPFVVGERVNYYLSVLGCKFMRASLGRQRPQTIGPSMYRCKSEKSQYADLKYLVRSAHHRDRICVFNGCRLCVP
jgi:septin family protein